MNISPHHVVSDFSDSSEEGILNTLWEKYKNAHDKVILFNSYACLQSVSCSRYISFHYPYVVYYFL
jgi:hypothetical protein